MRSSQIRIRAGGRLSMHRLYIRGRLAQDEALNLAGGCLREFGDEANFVGAFVAHEARVDPGVDFAVETAGGLHDSRAKNDETDRAGDADGIGVRYDGCFGHGRMREKRVFYFAGRDPHAGDFHHVVTAAAVVIEAVGVAREFIAGEDPVALARARREFGDVPVLRESASTFYP